MSNVRMNLELSQQILEIASTYGIANDIPADEMASALMLAGFCILSAGMNEVQFQAVVEQGAAFTADLRWRTEARWRASGFQHESDVVVPVVHVLHHGFALCGMISPPSSWPEGHRWVSIDMLDKATCDACLKSYAKHFQPNARQ